MRLSKNSVSHHVAVVAPPALIAHVGRPEAVQKMQAPWLSRRLLRAHYPRHLAPLLEPEPRVLPRVFDVHVACERPPDADL